MIVPQRRAGTLEPMRLRHLTRPALVLIGCVVLVGCSTSGRTSGSSSDPTPVPVVSATPEVTGGSVRQTTIVAVGDIVCDPTSPEIDDPASCRGEDVARLTGRLVRAGAEWFVPLGDLQYQDGRLEAFEEGYDRCFGRFLSITEPVAGNHEWYSGAEGYFAYFGDRAGTPTHPWRTFVPERGWRVVLLDSDCELVGGCGSDSPQGRWLSRVLARSDATCTMAVWHHPLHSSGDYGGDAATIARAQPLWDIADAGGVDLVLNGHQHLYERFAPIDGIRQFTVGTGGRGFDEVVARAARSQVLIGHRYGVLRLTLLDDGRYAYAFIDIDDKVLDAGLARCTNDAESVGGSAG